jgi:hypothetical protein
MTSRVELKEGLARRANVLGGEDTLKDLEAEAGGQVAEHGPGDAGEDAQVERWREHGLAGAPPEVGRRGLQQLAAQPDQDGVVGAAGPGRALGGHVGGVADALDPGQQPRRGRPDQRVGGGGEQDQPEPAAPVLLEGGRELGADGERRRAAVPGAGATG